MKILILALLTLTLSNSAFAQGNGFVCVSRWYRDAELSVNTGTITVKDSYMQGTREVARIIEEKMKLEGGKYLVNTIALNVNRDPGVTCTSTDLLVTCQGSSAKAWLAVTGWINSNGMTGELNLTVPVELKDLHLRTHLGSNGPISIGGDKPTKIEFRYLNLEASAKVVLHGQEVDLAWETFFNPRNDKNSGSYCSKY